jgi:hypothetical protein
MRVFKHPNLSSNWKCPICGLDTNKEVVLIKIRGTEKDNLIEAEQVHLDCLDLMLDKKLGIIFQNI